MIVNFIDNLLEANKIKENVMLNKGQVALRQKKPSSKIQSEKILNQSIIFSSLEKFLPPTLLGIITMLFYYPSIHYPFQFDDLANITKRFDIRFFNNWRFWDLFSPRWIADVLNKVSYQIGKFNPWCYRIVNISIHIMAGIMLYFIFFELLSRLEKNQFLKKNALLISFMTSALFLLHPVQTQTISYVIQARLEGLAALFIFLGAYFLIKTSHAKTKAAKYIFSSLFLLAGAISCGTKEIVIISPFLMMLIDWFFLAEMEWEKFRSRIWLHATFALVVFGIFLINNKLHWFTSIFGLKYSMNNNRGNILTRNPDDIITPLHYMISEFKVILHYLLIFIWPFDISVEYDWRLSDGFFAPDSFFPFLVLVAIVGFTLNLAYKKTNAFLPFGLLWFFTAIAPRSSIIPSSELICDYKTYLASAGSLFVLSVSFCYALNFIMEKFRESSEKSITHNLVISILGVAAIAYGYIAFTILAMTTSSYKPFAIMLFIAPALILYIIWYVITHKTNANLYSQKNAVLLSLILVFALGYSTIERNKVWESPVSFWKDIVIKAPQKARGHNNLGVALSEINKFDEAIEYYKRAISLDSNYSDPWSNIAVAYSMKGELDLAISSLYNAIKILPYYAEAYNNLGTLYLSKKEYDQAERILNMALQIRPYYGKAFFNLARVYFAKNDVQKAWEYAKKATEGDLDNVIGFVGLGEFSIAAGKYEEAIEAFQKAIAMGEGQPGVYFNLANALYMSKKYDESIAIYNKLIQLEPSNAGFLYNLGEGYCAKGDFEKALELFNRVKSLKDGLPESHFRFVHCLIKLNRQEEAKGYLQIMINAQAPDWFKDLAKQEYAKHFPEKGMLNINSPIMKNKQAMTSPTNVVIKKS